MTLRSTGVLSTAVDGWETQLAADQPSATRCGSPR